MSDIEQEVKALNKARKEARELESGLCSIRLGAKIDMRFKRFFWRDMVIAYGWSRMKSEPLPEGIEGEFYVFLSEKLVTLEKEIRATEDRLAAVEVPKQAGAPND